MGNKRNRMKWRKGGIEGMGGMPGIGRMGNKTNRMNWRNGGIEGMGGTPGIGRMGGTGRIRGIG